MRTPKEREGDLASQIGACRVGEQRVLQLVEKYGVKRLQALTRELLDYSERLVRAELRNMPAGDFSAEDWLDDDGVTDLPSRISVRLRFDPEAASIHADFAGTSAQVAGSVNAVRSITLSARFYVLRCLLADGAPATAGILRPLALETPMGSIVDALPPAAVAAGNVEPRSGSWAVGYALGAAIVALVMPRFGWRAVFFAGIAPALITSWLRRKLREPEDWRRDRSPHVRIGQLFHGALGRSVLICATMNAATLFAWSGLFTGRRVFFRCPSQKAATG